MNGHDIKLMKFKQYLTDKIATHLFIASKTASTEHDLIAIELKSVKDNFVNMVWRDGK